VIRHSLERKARQRAVDQSGHSGADALYLFGLTPVLFILKRRCYCAITQPPKALAGRQAGRFLLPIESTARNLRYT
jgi:hypothetical protein